jgi:hypothetical protein
MRDEESWHRESLLHDILGIFERCLKQLFEVLVVRIIMIACFFPFVNGITFPDANVEECVEK